jgi:hypothetical protein
MMKIVMQHNRALKACTGTEPAGGHGPTEVSEDGVCMKYEVFIVQSGSPMGTN